ncbi:ABC transporter permease [Phenylobacterium sp.]|uniref:ABC transporter permease n=1 Tax=Phenylobacterium sp. TaxID=1871053 RepID=UPI0035B06609
MQSVQHMVRTGRRGPMHEFSMAFADLRASFERIGLAWSLAWHDVVSRYRGSILGPFWITLSMGLMVAGIGFLYANLFKVPVNDFIPYVALGIVFWGMISNVILEGCSAFVQASGILSQTSLPMMTFVWRTVMRNVINFLHHLVIIVGVLIYYDHWRQANVPMGLVGLLLLLANISWISLAAGMASARFRDIPQIVASGIQFAMFMTPVFWLPGGRLLDHAVLLLNPFYHLLTVVRAPLLGQEVAPLTYGVLVTTAIVGWIATFATFANIRRRIVHYL